MNRLEWVLGILLVALLLIVVGLSALLWFKPSLPQMGRDVPSAGAIAPTSVFAGQTAKLGYTAAQKGLGEWYNDALLLSATATWPQGADEATIRSGAESWAYTFYSPENGKTALVTVTEGEAKLLSEGDYNGSVPISDVGGWNLDSEDAVRIFMDEGGAAFLSSAGPTTMVVKLTMSNDNGRIEWFVSLIDTTNGDFLNMRIDANSGEVLEIQQLPGG